MSSFQFKNKFSKGLLIAFSLAFFSTLNAYSLEIGGNVSGNPALVDTYNNNQIQLQSATQNQNQVQVNSYSRTGVVGATGGGGAGGGGATVIGSPSSFANTHLFNSPWNFTPPQILFHTSKTINDGSLFNCCRIVNTSAHLRRGVKDFLFGIYDEREFIASGMGGGGAFSGPVIACGLNTQLPAGCVNFIGSGYVFLEEYGSSEAALVALSRMAARNGANIIGNVNCAFAETIRSYTTSLGASAGFSDGVGDTGAVGASVGASWGTSRVKRPVQPHCSGDFYAGSRQGCNNAMAANMNQTYFPQPVPYRRYLPPAPAVSIIPIQMPSQMMMPPMQQMPQQMQTQMQRPINGMEPIRGFW